MLTWEAKKEAIFEMPVRASDAREDAEGALFKERHASLRFFETRD